MFSPLSLVLAENSPLCSGNAELPTQLWMGFMSVTCITWLFWSLSTCSSGYRGPQEFPPGDGKCFCYITKLGRPESVPSVCTVTKFRLDTAPLWRNACLMHTHTHTHTDCIISNITKITVLPVQRLKLPDSGNFLWGNFKNSLRLQMINILPLRSSLVAYKGRFGGVVLGELYLLLFFPEVLVQNFVIY